MAILFADNFSGYGNTPALMLNGLYAEVAGNLVPDPDPGATGTVLYMDMGLDAYVLTGFRRVFLSGSKTTIGAGERIWLPNLPIGTERPYFFILAGSANQQQISLTVTTTGVLQFIRDDPGGPIIVAQSATPVIVANSWQHVEIEVTAGVADGSCEARVNGVTVISANNVRTVNDVGDPVYAQIRNGAVGQYPIHAARVYIKDYFVRDDSGAFNTGFLGTVSVISLVPNADVSLNWTPSTGATGWPLLDNSPPLDGAEYIGAPFPAPAAYVAEITNLPINVSSVRAQITQVRACKEDGGDGNIQVSLISGGDTANGLNRPITTAFTYYEDVFETDPHTGAAWTPGAVDAARLKLNRTV